MFTSNKTEEFSETLTEFSSLCYENSQGYAYGAGFVESMLVSMFQDLPKARQKEWQKRLDSNVKYQKEKQV